MQEQFDPIERQIPEYSDSLHIYKARIVSKPDPGDDRLEVRIVPYMVSLPTTDPLPKYPPFFKGQVIVGYTEKEDKELADYVWVAALPDFTVGFVLGLANSHESRAKKYSHSYNYKDLIQSLSQRGLIPSYMSYKDMHVQYWNDNVIEMVNIRSGDKYIVQSTGNIIAMEKNQIYLRVGTGDSKLDGEKNKFSAIRITRDELSLTSPHIRLRGKKISVGEAGLYLAAIASSIPIMVQGATIHPITHTNA